MGWITLEELMPHPKSLLGDKSWNIKKMGLPDYWEKPLEFLSGYVESLIRYSTEFEGKRPGGVVFLSGDTYHDIYALLDEVIKEHVGRYVLYGVLVSRGFRVSFYKWERDSDGQVTKDVCKDVYNFNIPKEVRKIIGPTIRGMLNEVSDHDLKILKAGVHPEAKLHTVEEELDPIWEAYPPGPYLLI